MNPGTIKPDIRRFFLFQKFLLNHSMYEDTILLMNVGSNGSAKEVSSINSQKMSVRNHPTISSRKMTKNIFRLIP